LKAFCHLKNLKDTNGLKACLAKASAPHGPRSELAFVVKQPVNQAFGRKRSALNLLGAFLPERPALARLDLWHLQSSLMDVLTNG